MEEAGPRAVSAVGGILSCAIGGAIGVFTFVYVAFATSDVGPTDWSQREERCCRELTGEDIAEIVCAAGLGGVAALALATTGAVLLLRGVTRWQPGPMRRGGWRRGLFLVAISPFALAVTLAVTYVLAVVGGV